MASHAGYVVVDGAGRRWGFAAAAGLAPIPDDRATAGEGAPNVVAVGLSPTGHGTWTATADGRILVDGDSPWWGAPATTGVEAPVVDLAVAAGGIGYWVACANGRVHVHGDAAYHGSLEDLAGNDRVVGLAVTPSGDGYWMATWRGRVAAFGAAPDVGRVTPARGDRVVDVTGAPGGHGCWVATAAGTVTALGDAPALGAPADVGGSSKVGAKLVAVVTAPDSDPGYPPTSSGTRARRPGPQPRAGHGGGYWTLEVSGRVLAFGDALWLGSVPADALLGPARALAAIGGR